MKKLKNQFWKTQNWCFGTLNLHFPNLMVQLLPIITSLILDQLTWPSPKNVTAFQRQQDGIIESFIFVSVPIKGVFWQFEWSWAIAFGKVHYLFGKNMNSKCQNTTFIGTETKMNDSILLPVKSSYIFW